MTGTRPYGRRMTTARRTSVLACGHLAQRGAQIFQRPGERGWICERCALALARDAIAAKQARP
jgi:hypothetical protein